MISSKALYDRIINLDLKYWEDSYKDIVGSNGTSEHILVSRESRTIKIRCPSSGRKPSITFEWNRVPSDVCYTCKVTISNLYIHTEAAHIYEILLTAGYSSLVGVVSELFHLQVFASYTPSPGPDGYTVCECLVADATADIFGHRRFNFTLYNNPKRWTVKDVMDKLSTEMGIQVVLFSSHNLLDATFSEATMSTTNYTGFQLLGEVKQKLEAKVKPYGNNILMQVFDKKVSYAEISSTTGQLTQARTEISTPVEVLRYISNAEWNAGVLTITAPWNPKIVPGSVFSIDPMYYQGSVALPNEVALNREQRDPNNRYYVITQHCSFSTTGNTNSMQLVAVPACNSPLEGETLSFVADTDAYRKKYTDAQENLNVVTPIQLGEPAGDEKPQKIEDVVLNVGGDTYTVKSGDTLSGICARFNKPLKATNGIRNVNIPSSIAWIPVVLCATATKMKSDSKFYVNVNNPNDLRVDTKIINPSSGTWSSLQSSNGASIAKAFEACEAFYRNTKEASYADQFRDGASIMKDTENQWSIVV